MMRCGQPRGEEGRQKEGEGEEKQVRFRSTFNAAFKERPGELVVDDVELKKPKWQAVRFVKELLGQKEPGGERETPPRLACRLGSAEMFRDSSYLMAIWWADRVGGSSPTTPQSICWCQGSDGSWVLNGNRVASRT